MPCGAEPPGPCGVLRGVGVGPHAEPPDLRRRAPSAGAPRATSSPASSDVGRSVALEVLARPATARPAPRRRRPPRSSRRSRSRRPRDDGAAGRGDPPAPCRRRAPRRRRRRSCPCRGRRRRRGRSCRPGWSGCPPRRSCRSGRPGWSRGGPGSPSLRDAATDRGVRSRTRLADGGAGRGCHPSAIMCPRPARSVSNCGNISCTSWAPVTRRSASSASISPSSTSWVAIRNAAAAVRLPTRVCSIQSLPRSMVNSMSHRSR